MNEVGGPQMENYKEITTLLDAYHQLERGRRISRIKAAANRLRSLDPSNEILPELDAKIQALSTINMCDAVGSLTSAA